MRFMSEEGRQKRSVIRSAEFRVCAMFVVHPEKMLCCHETADLFVEDETYPNPALNVSE